MFITLLESAKIVMDLADVSPEALNTNLYFKLNESAVLLIISYFIVELGSQDKNKKEKRKNVNIVLMNFTISDLNYQLLSKLCYKLILTKKMNIEIQYFETRLLYCR
jgi:hypothetical protein